MERAALGKLIEEKGATIFVTRFLTAKNLYIQAGYLKRNPLQNN